MTKSSIGWTVAIPTTISDELATGERIPYDELSSIHVSNLVENDDGPEVTSRNLDISAQSLDSSLGIFYHCEHFSNAHLPQYCQSEDE